MSKRKPHDLHSYPFPRRTQLAIERLNTALENIRCATVELEDLEDYYGFYCC